MCRKKIFKRSLTCEPLVGCRQLFVLWDQHLSSSVRSFYFLPCNSNVKGVIYDFKAVIPAIKSTVGEKGPTGSIVVNSSGMAQAVIGPKSGGAALYSASKAFVSSLTETAAVENAPRIRVNAVQPGVVATSMMDTDTANMVGAALQPLWGRAGQPVEVASLVGYLISDEASFISGTNIRADGLWCLSGGELPAW
jgi:NAD(P)-dependent dehydrogenase (short-subunit alcohol dehydrogenase family)